VETIKAAQFLNKVKDEIKSPDIGKYVGMIERLIEADITSLDIAAALLKMQMAQTSTPDKKQAGMEDFGDTGAEHGMVRLFP